MTAAAPAPDDPAARPVFEAVDVAVHFGGIKAVDGISLGLTSGKVFGIIGPNGSGKSTLLAAMTGLVPLTSGSFRFRDEEYRDRSAAAIARSGVARTFQTVRLVRGLTVLENVQLGADQPWTLRSTGDKGRVRWASRRESSVQQVRIALERTGLVGFESLRPPELPYGTQRRVEIARAIAGEPRLLLLDEPTAGMNEAERREISGLLRKLRGEGLTLLLVEHDVQMMVDTCDYVFAMNSGVMIAQGRPASLVKHPAVREAYLGKRWSANA